MGVSSEGPYFNLPIIDIDKISTSIRWKRKISDFNPTQYSDGQPLYKGAWPWGKQWLVSSVSEYWQVFGILSSGYNN